MKSNWVATWNTPSMVELAVGAVVTQTQGGGVFTTTSSSVSESSDVFVGVDIFERIDMFATVDVFTNMDVLVIVDFLF